MKTQAEYAEDYQIKSKLVKGDKVWCIHAERISITYKEGDFGYKITSHGDILEKWRLDDGGC
jgi:hypothetical protein